MPGSYLSYLLASLLALYATLSLPLVHADEAAPDCSRQAGSLPRPEAPPGSPDPANPIEHAIVLMSENHSFDNVYGRLTQPQYYGNEIDGLAPGQFNLDQAGVAYEPFHLGKDCVKDMSHSWDTSRADYDNGTNASFVRNNDSSKHDGFRVMGYYDQEDYPLMYFLADRYSVADRFFSSVLGPTHPNRWYFYSATSHGRINNKLPNVFKGGWQWKTIFEQLNDAGVSWTYYQADVSNVMFFTKMYLKNLKHVRNISRFKADARANRLSQVVFLEPSTITGEEHPPMSFEMNQHAVAKHLQDLIDSPAWPTSAFFMTYDEGGGNWDHVPPPRACAPDSVAPVRDKGETAPGGFDRLGFRVPAVVVSPFAKRHFVSHTIYDHTSILKFIEHKFNVPALTGRDANADPMLEMFDFGRPDFSRPELPRPKVLAQDLWDCLFKKGYRD